MNKSMRLLNRLVFFALLFSVMAASFLTVRAAGETDTAFRSAVQDTTSVEVSNTSAAISGSVNTLAVQPDGKLLVGGNFTVAGNSAQSGIARLNSDGSTDTTFNSPDFYKPNALRLYSLKDASIYAIAVQTDGKILVGGDFARVGYTNLRKGVVRLNSDGSLDTSFNVPFFANSDFIVYDIKIQSDNKIILGGDFTLRQNGTADQQQIGRVNPDGSLDSTYHPGVAPVVRSFALQPDGKVLVQNRTGSTVYLKRTNIDGTDDTSFNYVYVSGIDKIAVQTDGKIIIAGSFTTVNNFNQFYISRLNSDGTLDTTFNPNGSGANFRVKDVAILTSGKIAIAGDFNFFNGVSRTKNALLNSDGTLDAASVNYNPGANAVVNAVAPTADGKFVLGGSDRSGLWNKLARLTSGGLVDTTFNGTIYRRGIVQKVAVQADGKVLIAGIFNRIDGVTRQGFARLNVDGRLDASFDATALRYIIGVTVAVQPDGKILVGGLALTNVNAAIPKLQRLNSDGSVDTSFTINTLVNPLGWVEEIIPLADGKILVAGNYGGASGCVYRLNANGSIDNTFTLPTGTPYSYYEPNVRTMKLQTDGKIVIGGFFSFINGVGRGRIARLNADGTLDTTFNPPLGASSDVYDLAIQSNGNIVIGGSFTGVNGVNSKFRMARLLPDGNLDQSFTPSFNAPVFAIERQDDDKLLVGGDFTPFTGGIERFKLARLNANGTLDSTFTGNGANDLVNDILIQPDKNILIGGEFSRVNNFTTVSVARLLNNANGRTPFDFDGDGKADVSVFRPSTGVWFTSTNPALNYGAILFGISTDKLVPADYDGDGRTDVAVYRNGTWYLQRSQAGFTGVSFGFATDIPVPADYDGDGKADVAVFRPSNGTWYLLKSLEGYAAVPFGDANDKPVPADYDGDGRANVAVFRPSNGYWFTSTNPAINYGAVLFGTAEDKPVPADYDGDGRIDIAVFRPSNGTWYLNRSRDGFAGITFGLGTDLPVAADYDGDGKADVAVFRNGTWYLNRTTQGFSAVAFGLSDDKPVPNAFVR